MNASDRHKDIEFGGPAAYRIVVQGVLDDGWSDDLAGLTVSRVVRDEPCASRTVLLGRLRDQAELSGVLDTLYGLHLPILSVETVDDGS